MDQQRIVSVFAWACLSLLGACGGGGGADGPGVLMPPVASNPPAPNPAPVESSLIPEAGPVGAVLYADAAPLYVLRTGATWTYRGTVQPQGTAGTDNLGYTNEVSFTGPDAQEYTQHNTNLFNKGISTGAYRVEAGASTVGINVEFTSTGSHVFEMVGELRSPVRANDLYGAVERRNVDIGTDLDGDRVNETATVAIYSRVAAKESVDLPNRRGVEAVRVDMTVRVRVTASASRTAWPVHEIVRSSWHAPGIGMIKLRMEEPNLTPGLPNRVVTEVLETWDGLTEGIGHLPARAAVAPASSPVAGSALQFPMAVAGFDTHVVVAGHIPGSAPASGIMLAQLDGNGTMLAARNYAMAELFPGAPWVNETRLVRSGSELRLFARLGSGSVGMAALDATGQRLLRPPVTVLTDSASGIDYDGTSYRVVADGAGFWLAWMRKTQDRDGRYLGSALVTRVDGSGQALTQPRVVIEPVAADIHDLSLAADGNRAGLSWYEGNLPSVRRRLATVDAASMAVASRTLDIAPESCLQATVLDLQPGLAITCWNNALTPVAAARIDAMGQPLLANGATLAGEAFKAPWLANLNGGALGMGDRGELYVVANQYAPYWPGESESGFTTVLRTNSGGALAAREPELLARLRGVPSTVRFAVRLENRLLLLGSDIQGNLNSTSVWLPK